MVLNGRQPTMPVATTVNFIQSCPFVCLNKFEEVLYTAALQLEKQTKNRKRRHLDVFKSRSAWNDKLTTTELKNAL